MDKISGGDFVLVFLVVIAGLVLIKYGESDKFSSKEVPIHYEEIFINKHVEDWRSDLDAINDRIRNARASSYDRLSSEFRSIVGNFYSNRGQILNKSEYINKIIREINNDGDLTLEDRRILLDRIDAGIRRSLNDLEREYLTYNLWEIQDIFTYGGFILLTLMILTGALWLFFKLKGSIQNEIQRIRSEYDSLLIFVNFMNSWLNRGARINPENLSSGRIMHYIFELGQRIRGFWENFIRSRRG